MFIKLRKKINKIKKNICKIINNIKVIALILNNNKIYTIANLN